MKKILSLFLLLGVFMNINASFLDEQKKFSRVRDALSQKDTIVLKTLEENLLNKDSLNIIFIAYKDEEILELWAKNKTDSQYKFIKKFNICASSGVLGPKSKQGDRQVPEGFYYIDRFNPASNFYLSLGINYPNSSDKKRGDGKNLGGDIFIHGNCVSIGCLAMRDEYIKEIYLYALYAKNSSQNKIPVYIFPFNMKNENFQLFQKTYKEQKELIDFWSNLKIGFDKFFETKIELKYKYGQDGDYIF